MSRIEDRRDLQIRHQSTEATGIQGRRFFSTGYIYTSEGLIMLYTGLEKQIKGASSKKGA